MKNARLVYVIAATLFLTIGGFSHAAIYSGTGPGESTIGTGGDYTSLNAACEAINSQPLNGGDWTFLILNDLNEPANPSIIQDELNGNRITLRPAPNTSSTVTFTTTSVQSAIRTYGHLTIGALVYRPSGGNTTRVFEATHNITIDGSNTPGGSEQNLTFKNVDGPGARTLIAVQGDCDYTTFRNCSFEAYGVPSVTPNYLPAACLDFLPTLDDINEVEDADSASISNCRFVNKFANPSTAIGFNTTPLNLPVATLSSLVQISSNETTGFARGVQAIFTDDLNVSNNRIHLFGTTPSVHNVTGIYTHQTMNNTIISGNTISFACETLKELGLQGIVYQSWIPGSVARIENNSISGIMSLDNATFKSTTVRYGIRALANEDTTATIHHNSIDMFQLPTDNRDVPNCAGLYVGGLSGTIGDEKGKIVFKNNIVRMGIKSGYAIGTQNTEPKLISDSNNLYVISGAYYGRKISNNYSSLADWQTATNLDHNSISQDPYVAGGPGFGTWIGPKETPQADLHFTAYPGPLYLVPALIEVTHDIDGEPRNATSVVMGADEMEHPNAAVDNWSIY